MIHCSIIMPMHNARPYVEAALASLTSEHDANLQIIVVDDRSTDGSAKIVQQRNDPRIQLIPGPGQGITAAFNTGLDAATAPVVMRCDADDLFAPGRIARQLAFLQTHPDFLAVCGTFDTIDTHGRIISDLTHAAEPGDITSELLAGHTRTHLGTFAIRTDILRQLGGCRSFFVTAEDIDLQLRLADRGRVWYHPQLAYHYRLHHTSITHQQNDAHRLFYEHTARLLARQRRTRGHDDLQRGAPPTLPRASTRRVTTADQHIQRMLIGRAWRERATKGRLHALRLNLRACALGPTNFDAWRSFLSLLVK